jgi:acyl carrier protein
MSDTKEIINKILIKQFGNFLNDESDIDPGNTLEDLNADSLDIIEVIMFIEDAFDIEIHDDNIEGFSIKTISGIYEYVDGLIENSKNNSV